MQFEHGSSRILQRQWSQIEIELTNTPFVLKYLKISSFLFRTDLHTEVTKNQPSIQMKKH